MPISSRARVLDYLGSAPNLVGSALGLTALFIIAITGLGGALWPALVLLAYATGAVIGQLSFASTATGRTCRLGLDRAERPSSATAQRSGRSGVRTVSENLTMACRRCQSGRVSSIVLDESMSKISSICRATPGLKTSMLIS